MKWISVLLVLGTFTAAKAATIAVIDSGLDYKHEFITPNLWTNPGEVEDNRDEDGDGYQDNVHGWNFAEQNGKIIDYKYLGTFSPDCTKYFDIQGKYFLKKATPEEIDWMKSKQKDKDFLKQMGIFGNFVHGTHVAGISIKDSSNSVMGIKLIPTQVGASYFSFSEELVLDRWSLLEKGFNALANAQMAQLAEIARFVDHFKADVANGSFGTGFKQAKIISDNAFKILFLRKPKEDESNRAAGLFLKALISNGQQFVSAAPNTLFVFAAGNDGMDNDKFGTSPANIKADNVITVGATYKNEFFAPFSNYGTGMVEIAAPGMLIHSSIPGNEYLQVSGTSQAAPYVANVAAKIKQANPSLTPAQIKKVLMGTVDKKAFLTDKIQTGGIVNSDRAVVAAELTKKVSMEEALQRAKVQVRDAPSEQTFVNPHVVTPLPLTPSFL